MISYPHPNHIKRSTAGALLKHIKHPILFARAMLLHGDTDLAHPSPIDHPNSGQGHSYLSGPYAEHLAREWGLEMVESEKYFWTRRRWEEHRRGLKRGSSSSGSSSTNDEKQDTDTDLINLHTDTDNNTVNDADTYPLLTSRPDEPGWDGHTYLAQGTVGAVALDSLGTLCTATSTGGLTNKLPGRIGDTPTVGAGYWAESWSYTLPTTSTTTTNNNPFSLETITSTTATLLERLFTPLRPCIPSATSSSPTSTQSTRTRTVTHSTALSGTGNGDSFLRLAATRTISAMIRFSSLSPPRTLASAVTQVAGPAGELQQSAGDRWGRTGEGEGGVIGIELVYDSPPSSSLDKDGRGEEGGHGEERETGGTVVFDFNCGGLMRCYVDPQGVERAEVFR